MSRRDPISHELRDNQPAGLPRRKMQVSDSSRQVEVETPINFRTMEMPSARTLRQLFVG